MREWLKRQSWKDCMSEMASRVQIPPSPQRVKRARKRASKLLCSRGGFEDRSYMRRASGEEYSEGRPASAKTEGEATCRQIPPSPLKRKWNDLVSFRFWFMDGLRNLNGKGRGGNGCFPKAETLKPLGFRNCGAICSTALPLRSEVVSEE